MNIESNSQCNLRTVCDPVNRKSGTWQLGFAAGAAGHIVDKHLKRTDEPWESAIDDQEVARLRRLPSRDRTSTDTSALKNALLDHAKLACDRPQVLTYDECDVANGKAPVRCGFLVCRCGLLIAIRNVNTSPKIHTAYFRKSLLKFTDPKNRWRKLVQQLRSEYAYIEPESGLSTYPALEFAKPVQDTSAQRKSYDRLRIEFHSKHTWGFVESAGVFRPTGEIPQWQEPFG